MGVLWAHVWYVSGTDYFHHLELIPVLRMGSFGVDVFFGISGFLITTLLLRERAKKGKISLRDFYLRRSLRIWPLYYAVLGLYVFLVVFLQRGTGRDHVFFHFLPGYLTYTYTWFAGWATSGAIISFCVVLVCRRAILCSVGGGLARATRNPAGSGYGVADLSALGGKFWNASASY